MKKIKRLRKTRTFSFLQIFLYCKHKARTIPGTDNTPTKSLWFLQYFQTSVKLVNFVCFQTKRRNYVVTLLLGFRVKVLIFHVEEKSEIILLFFYSFPSHVISVLEAIILEF